MELKINPFLDSAIINYEQFKRYPFIPFSNWEIIKNRIHQQIKQIKGGYFFGDRTVLLGSRGIGKTTTLFAIKEMLESNQIRVELFSRLIEDAEHFKIIVGDSIYSASLESIYILIDFPDTLELKSFKRFLEFLWSLMTHKNYNKINLIFALNQSHYDKSFSYSEILGKFITHRLESLNYEESKRLIVSRIEEVGLYLNDFFDEETIKLIYSYSKGIPRNILSASNVLTSNCNGERMDINTAQKILKEKYVQQVIGDRVEDINEREIYVKILDILREDFNGCVETQKEFVSVVNKKVGVGVVSTIKKIDNLLKWGVLSYKKVGDKRTNKMISFS